jgi:hypothetical protein
MSAELAALTSERPKLTKTLVSKIRARLVEGIFSLISLTVFAVPDIETALKPCKV